MPFPQHDAPMRRADARELRRERFVIGPPVRFDARGDFGVRRLGAGLVDRLAAELHDRAKPVVFWPGYSDALSGGRLRSTT